MISREKLEELVKNNGKIYHILEFNGEYVVEKSRIVDFNVIDFLYSILNSSEDIWFETKEDAEFTLKYKNITQVKSISLPTWEEITTDEKYKHFGKSCFEFNDYRLIVSLRDENHDFEYIGIDVNGNCELYNWDEATKENYIKACEICKKLFLGEKL